MTSLSQVLNSISDVFVSLLDHAIIAWWLEEAMPITSTENTAGQYILYHHAATDRHCTVTCSHVSMDLTSNRTQQDQFPVTSPDADSVIFGVHNWMNETCE
jgi:hypothetical protein